MADAGRGARQTRLKTSVPLVPPKPKLFLTAYSIFISRAVVGAVVEIALRILVEDVDRRRRDLVVQRQHGEHRLDAAGAAEQVAGHRLGRVDDQLLRVVAERELDRVGLVDVAERRRRAVRVEVLDLVGVERRPLRSAALHRALRAVDVRRGHVERVGAHAEADQLGVDLGAAPLRVLVLLEHQDAGALAEDEAVAVLVPRAARRSAGSSLRVDSARAAAKPPMPSGETVASAPPAIITSASPYSISRPAIADASAGRSCRR